MFFPAVVGPDGSYRWIRKDTTKICQRADYGSIKLNFETKSECVGFLMAKTLNKTIVGIIYDQEKGIFLPLEIKGTQLNENVRWYNSDTINQKIKCKKIGG